MRGYVIYLLLVVLAFALWILLFIGMRKGRGRTREAAGFLLLGPFHSYMRKRNYSLSSRELVGWGVVFVVMLLAPLLSKWLEQ